MGITYFVAARKFQDIIRREFEGLYPTPVKWPQDSSGIYPILEEKYSRLETAVDKFKGHLPTCLVQGFNTKWIKYYNAYGNARGQCYHHYMPFGSNPNYKETFKKNVENLLKYAKQI